MKKNNQKASGKAQKKAVKKELTLLIKAALASIIVNFAKSNKNTAKTIAKSTKQLVKKFSIEKINLQIPTEALVLVEEAEEKIAVPTKTKKPAKTKS
ncbi:hypothetical protein WG904_11705 [Pedobacter sp. Du54]|uniref:hypothetical protein n=1 Tax=Pedobacter anseongensis TaxID=3133439 RepID=UPI0030AB1531